jgi:3(or 17)beta-hydroxysteroid dehydrogenase
LSEGLKGKVALVTGAASGIGAATVDALHRYGAMVVATDIKGERAVAQAAEDTPGAGSTAFIAHDVTEESSWERAIGFAVKAFGGLDIIVNNAGVAPAMVPLEDTSLEEWRRVMSVNLDGVFLGVKHGFRCMKGRGGSIINLSSVAGLVAAPLQGAYAPSKGGVLMLTKAAALEGAKMKPAIRVNAVHPGYTNTHMVSGIADAIGAGKLSERIRKMVPLGEMGSPGDIAEAIAFLASSRSKYMTGASMVVDGGFTSQ